MTKARDIASAIPAPSTVSSAELGYLDGVTSALQTQLDAKTAKSTLSTTGDIYYASAANTPARLGIGSTGNVLTVASGIPSWAAPAGGSLRLITRTTFSNVASQTFDSVFSSTYKVFQIVFEKVTAVTGTDDFHLQLRYGSTTNTDGYASSAVRLPANSATWTNVSPGTDGAFVLLSQNIGETGYNGTSGIMYAFNIGNGSSQPSLIADTADVYNFGGQYRIATSATTERSYTGFILKSSSTNISGTVAVYGLATS